MRKFGKSQSWAILALVMTLGVGCGDDNPTSPGIQPEILNNVDSFQYQVTDVTNYTREHAYAWENTGAAANVDQSTTVTGGSVMLTIRDADGNQVYQRSLSENGSFVSEAGTPGTWTIRISYDHATTTVNFRVQKST